MKNIIIKTREEIKNMRIGGRKLAKVMGKLAKLVRPGVDVFDIEKAFLDMCKEEKIKPACKGYAPYGLSPFPTGLCLGLNSETVHCYPQKGKTIKDTDLVKIDTIIEYEKTFVDMAITLTMPNAPKNAKDLTNVTKDALDATIKKIAPGIRIGVLSNTMKKITSDAGYSVLQDYAGHGIGRYFHEGPDIPCYGRPHWGDKLKAGMTIAIEPLVCEKRNELVYKDDWQTQTADNGLFAQIEHTVLVTETGYEILTKND